MVEKLLLRLLGLLGLRNLERLVKVGERGIVRILVVLEVDVIRLRACSRVCSSGECYGVSLLVVNNRLLNDYRVRAACRRLNQEQTLIRKVVGNILEGVSAGSRQYGQLQSSERSGLQLSVRIIASERDARLVVNQSYSFLCKSRNSYLLSIVNSVNVDICVPTIGIRNRAYRNLKVGLCAGLNNLAVTYCKYVSNISNKARQEIDCRAMLSILSFMTIP